MATQDAFEDKQFCRANTIPDMCTLYITSKPFEHSTNVCIEVDTSYKSFPLNEAGENCRKLWCSLSSPTGMGVHVHTKHGKKKKKREN